MYQSDLIRCPWPHFQLNELSQFFMSRTVSLALPITGQQYLVYLFIQSCTCQSAIWFGPLTSFCGPATSSCVFFFLRFFSQQLHIRSAELDTKINYHTKCYDNILGKICLIELVFWSNFCFVSVHICYSDIQFAG